VQLLTLVTRRTLLRKTSLESTLSQVGLDCVIQERSVFLTPVTRYQVTENEIQKGVLDNPDNADKTLCFQREIEDMHENIGQDARLAARFIDLDSADQVDNEAQILLDELKTKKIPDVIPATNMFKYKVKWSKDGGITYETHKSYFEQLGKDVFNSIKGLVDRNYKKASFFDKLSNDESVLLRELFVHYTFSAECVERFHGRVDFIEKVGFDVAV
jgi:hypothetical protein